MVVYGGMANEEWKWNGAEASPLSIFVYSCGLWVNLEAENTDSLQAAAMTIDQFNSNEDKENIYLLGKFVSFSIFSVDVIKDSTLSTAQ